MIGCANRSSRKRQLSYSIENEVRIYKFRQLISRQVRFYITEVGVHGNTGGPGNLAIRHWTARSRS